MTVRLHVHRIELVADEAGVVSQIVIDGDAFTVPEPHPCTLTLALVAVAKHYRAAELAAEEAPPPGERM